MTAQAPPFTELIAIATTRASHLEMRDTYTPADPDYTAWLAGKPITLILESPDHRWWYNLVRAHAQRGVEFRRARIVSEPVTDFIRYEYESTPILNLPPPQQVRCLPRPPACPSLPLPRRQAGMKPSPAGSNPPSRQSPTPTSTPGARHATSATRQPT